MTADITGVLAEFAATLTYDDMPERVRDYTKNLLLDTLALAQVRSLDAEALDTAVVNPIAGAAAIGEVAHYLPALHFAVNVDGDAIAPDFKALST